MSYAELDRAAARPVPAEEEPREQFGAFEKIWRHALYLGNYAGPPD